MYSTTYRNAPAFPSPPEHFAPVDRPFAPPVRPADPGREIVIYVGPNLDNIAQEVMERHAVKSWEFYSDDRTHRVSLCRFEFMWRAKRVLAHAGTVGRRHERYSLLMIGRHFKLRGRPRAYDHTSVIHGVKRWEGIRKEHLKLWIAADNARLAAIHGARS